MDRTFKLVLHWKGKQTLHIKAGSEEKAMKKYKAHSSSNSREYFMDVLHGNVKIYDQTIEKVK